MGFRLVSHAASLLVSFDRAVTTRALLAADPRTAHLVAGWDAWVIDWKTTFLQELDHRVAVLSAQALATIMDDDLDEIAVETWIDTEGDAAERQFYFLGKTRAQFTAPRLGVQYKRMGAWITHMAGSKDPRILDIGVRLAKKHQAAGDAITDADTKETAARDFRLTGPRKQIIDRYNALGKSTEGELKEMPFAQPDLHLPKDFFQRFLRSPRSVTPPSVEDLTKKRDAAKEDLDAIQADLDAAIKAEKDAADEVAREQRVADQKLLAEAQAEADAKNKAVADLRAKLGLPPLDPTTLPVDPNKPNG